MARLLREGSDDLVVLLLSFLDTKDLDQCRATSRRLCSVGGGSAWLWRLQLSRCFLFSLAPSARRARAAGSGAAWRSLYRKAMGSLMRQEKRWRERETRAWASYERARQPAAPHLGAVEELLEAEKEVFRERQLMDVFCAMSPFEGGRAATFPAGPVAGGKRRRLVEEEQFGVASRRHDLALAAFERQRADDPRLVLPAADAEAARAVMQDAAIAHEIALRRVGDDLAQRRHAVLQSHAAFPCPSADAFGAMVLPAEGLVRSHGAPYRRGTHSETGMALQKETAG